MKAYIVEQAGGIEVLQLKDISSKAPNADEVQIRVRAFGVNRAEIYRRAGNMGEITAPVVLGIEAVGEVIHDPAGVFQVDEKVATAMGGLQFTRHGSYAEEVTVLRSNVISLKDTTLPWRELAALPEAYLTIWGALVKTLKVQVGQTILIRGATSSVGLAAVAYAKSLGLRVIATTRNEANRARLHTIGADVTIVDNGAIADLVKAVVPSGVDVALEVVGASTLKDTIKAVKPFGAVTVIGLLGGAPVLSDFHLMQDLPTAVQLSFFPSGLIGTSALPLTDNPLVEIAHQIAAGHIPSIVTQVLPFSEVRQAHTMIENNQVLGKLVIEV
ncbi:zinc-binding dehydrogenase [Aquirhabdus sp.]|uniref:zinc-binding dehydrogenase n=1 Tax=Aquirhabdus sp. TaxID=2824160 RepID=UPI00396C3BBA